MRTLLIPIAYLTVFSAALLLVGWTLSHGLQLADAAHGIHVVTPVTTTDVDAGEDRGSDEDWEDSQEVAGIS